VTVADNVELDPGTGGAVIATDDVTSVHYQRVKLVDGVLGNETAVAAGGGVEAGALRVTVASDSTGVLSVDDNGSSLTVDVGTALPAGNNNIGDVDVASSALPSGASTSALQTTGNGILTTIDADTGTIAGAVSGTEMQVDVVAALPAGDNNIGNVDLASAIPAGTNNIGDVDVLTIAAGTNAIGNVGVVPRTTGGLTIFRSIDVDETEEEAKGTAGQVFGWYFYNDGAAEVYVKFYNATAANVTVGTTTPVLTIPIPAGAAANVFSSIGVAFGTAITVAATTGVADNDTGAPAANQVVGNVFYS
jgi:hypothetical protein